MGQLQQQILLLSREERLRLVQYIIDSIRFEDFSDQQEVSIPIEQQKELERRSDSLKNGTAEFLTWEEIKNSLKK